MDKEFKHTLLTEPESPEDAEKRRIQEDEKRKIQEDEKRHRDCVEILCQTMVNSLEEKSITFVNAVKKINSITTTSKKNELISEKSASDVAANYIKACMPYIDIEKPKNGVASDLVRLIKEGHAHLKGHPDVKKSESGDGYRYVHQAAVLKRYGVDVTESQINHWLYEK